LKYKPKKTIFLIPLAIVTAIAVFSLISSLINNNSDVDTPPEIAYSLSGEYFNIATPFKRGVAENYIPVPTNNRVDINETELGLMRIATKYYDVNNYLSQPGQYLTTNKIDNIIEVANEDNSYISYIIEQNYLTKNNRLAGIVIGVVINPFFSDTPLTNDQINEFMIEINPVIIEQLRSNDDLKNTRIVIAAFRMEPRTSLTPGTFILEQQTTSDAITRFVRINQAFYVLTDPNLRRIDERTSKSFANIRTELETTFPNAVITGIGNYHDDNLRELRIDVNAGFIRPHEVLAISNHLITSFNRYFTRDINMIININSDNRTLAIININRDTRGNINLLI